MNFMFTDNHAIRIVNCVSKVNVKVYLSFDCFSLHIPLSFFSSKVVKYLFLLGIYARHHLFLFSISFKTEYGIANPI